MLNTSNAAYNNIRGDIINTHKESAGDNLTKDEISRGIISSLKEVDLFLRGQKKLKNAREAMNQLRKEIEENNNDVI